MFIIAMVSVGVHPLSEVGAEDIVTAMNALVISMPTDDETNETFENIAQFSCFFLWWLSARGDIKLTTEQIAKAFKEATDEHQPTPDDFDDMDVDLNNVDPCREMYHYDRRDLPEYLDKTAGKIRETGRNIAEELVDSGELKPIIGNASELVEEDIVSNLTDLVSHLYGEYRLTPSKWTKKALKGVLTGFLIKDAWIRPNEYPQVGAILKLFLTFAVDTDFVSEKIADRMKRAIDEVEPEMIRLGSDKGHFSEGKRHWVAKTNANHIVSKDVRQSSMPLDDVEPSDFDFPEVPTEPGSEGRVISLAQWKKKNKKRKKGPRQR